MRNAAWTSRLASHPAHFVGSPARGRVEQVPYVTDLARRTSFDVASVGRNGYPDAWYAGGSSLETMLRALDAPSTFVFAPLADDECGGECGGCEACDVAWYDSGEVECTICGDYTTDTAERPTCGECASLLVGARESARRTARAEEVALTPHLLRTHECADFALPNAGGCEVCWLASK